MLKAFIATMVLGGLFITAPTIYDSVFTSKKSVKVINNVKKEDIKVMKKTAPVKFAPIKRIYPNQKQVRKLTLVPERTVTIFGPIGFRALGAAEKIATLASQSSDPIFVVLSSPGGSVIAGAAVISAIQAANAPVYTVCYSFCASMAAMIHQYGTRRYATDRSMIMFHPASARLEGNMDELLSFTTSMIKFVSKIEIEIADRIGLSYRQYKNAVANELWVDSDEAKTANIIDQIVYTRFPYAPFGALGLYNKKQTEELKIHTKDLVWIYKGRM